MHEKSGVTGFLKYFVIEFVLYVYYTLYKNALALLFYLEY